MVSTTWWHDLDSGICDLTVVGLLDLEGAGQLRGAVRKILAEQPVGVLVDLNAVAVATRTPLLILPTLDERAVDECGIRLRYFLRTQHPQRTQIEAALGSAAIPLYHTRDEARLASLHDAGGLPRFRRHFTGTQTNLAVARAIVDDVCAQWGIEHLADDAGIIVSELVSNAVQHTDEDFDLILLLRRSLLHIQVIDANRRVPVFPIGTAGEDLHLDVSRSEGLGLYLVNAIASACGVAVRPPGKIVWATLRIK